MRSLSAHTTLPPLDAYAGVRNREAIPCCRGKLPENLCVRLSLDFIDDDPAKRRIKGMPHSVVSTKALDLPDAVDCPATFTEAKSCDAHRCHACWDRNVALINYHQH